jgi:CubicO group peptidase (beta-lactamase class C family)
VPAENKTPESFFPGFWDGMGWGFGVGVQTEGPLQGRYGWSGGQGTHFFVDQDGTLGILLTQGGGGGTDVAVARRVPGPSPADLTSRIPAQRCLSVLTDGPEVGRLLGPLMSSPSEFIGLGNVISSDLVPSAG